MEIRKACAKDENRIKYICIQTADEVLRKTQAVSNITAKLYSEYYIRECSETCFVAENESGVQGYILCAPDYKNFSVSFRKNQVKEIRKLSFFKGISAFFLPLAYLPFKKKYPAHMHIDILPDYTGGGTGSRLIEALFEELKKENINGLMLILGSKNSGAKRFYERHGFKKVYSAFGATTMVKKL